MVFHQADFSRIPGRNGTSSCIKMAFSVIIKMRKTRKAMARSTWKRNVDKLKSVTLLEKGSNLQKTTMCVWCSVFLRPNGLGIFTPNRRAKLGKRCLARSRSRKCKSWLNSQWTSFVKACEFYYIFLWCPLDLFWRHDYSVIYLKNIPFHRVHQKRWISAAMKLKSAFKTFSNSFISDFTLRDLKNRRNYYFLMNSYSI